jgi:ATP-dependent DNA helicase RecQ
MGFGAVHLIDVLRGKETDKVRQHRHDRLSTFGIGADLSEAQWRAVLRQLIALGQLRAVGEYHTLALTGSSRALLRGEVPVRLRVPAAAPKRGERVRAERPPKAAPLPLDDAALARFAALKAWRAEVAKQHNLPAFVIFHDATLIEAARMDPADLAALAAISGIGAHKLSAYGEAMLRVLAAHRDAPDGAAAFAAA